MPYMITLREPISDFKGNYIGIIITETIVADGSTQPGMIEYKREGKYCYLPIANILGTVYQDDKKDSV